MSTEQRMSLFSYERCDTAGIQKNRKNVSLPLLSKKKFKQNSLSTINRTLQYSDSSISNLNINRLETNSVNKDSIKLSSIHSNDHHNSLSSSIENITTDSRSRTQLTYLLSSDFVQSPANFIYPNIRILSSGYFFNRTNESKQNLMYIFPNPSSSSNKNIPLVFLGSEYFLRKPLNFEYVKYPLSTNEYLEPLIDLFLHRPQFLQEIPQLDDLSNYLLLPQSISALGFFNTLLHQSTRHLCYELRTNENQNTFTLKDLLNISQRENNIIQMNALNDKRFQTLKDQLTEIYSSEINHPVFEYT